MYNTTGGIEVEFSVIGSASISLCGWTQPFDDEEEENNDEEIDSEEYVL